MRDRSSADGVPAVTPAFEAYADESKLKGKQVQVSYGFKVLLVALDCLFLGTGAASICCCASGHRAQGDHCERFLTGFTATAASLLQPCANSRDQTAQHDPVWPLATAHPHATSIRHFLSCTGVFGKCGHCTQQPWVP